MYSIHLCIGLECALYCSKLFGLIHGYGSNMAANEWQKTAAATDDRLCKGDIFQSI